MLSPPQPENAKPSNGTLYTATLQLPLGIDSSIKQPTNQDGRWSSSDVEIGEVLARAQRFADEVADRAARRAQEIVGVARTEAAAIVERARQDAHALSAAPPPIAPEAVASLCAAIQEFAASNRTLVAELSQLSEVLVELGPDTAAPKHRMKPAAQSEGDWLPVGGTGSTAGLVAEPAGSDSCGQEIRQGLEQGQ